MDKIEIRPGQPKDVAEIMKVIEDARGSLKLQGVDQWQGKYPAEEDIVSDIAAGTNRVLTYNGVVAGNASLTKGPEMEFEQLTGGTWATSNDYAVIHRVAVGNDFRGKHLSQKLLEGLIAEVKASDIAEIRADTHPDNKGMQHILETIGFEKRGIIRYEWETYPERFAYEYAK